MYYEYIIPKLSNLLFEINKHGRMFNIIMLNYSMKY